MTVRYSLLRRHRTGSVGHLVVATAACGRRLVFRQLDSAKAEGVEFEFNRRFDDNQHYWSGRRI
jgi:hypothetical protein